MDGVGGPLGFMNKILLLMLPIHQKKKQLSFGIKTRFLLVGPRALIVTFVIQLAQDDKLERKLFH